MSNLHVPRVVVVLAAVAAVGGLRAGDVGASSREGAPNGSSVGVDDAYEMVQDTTLVVGAPGVLAHDVDPDGDPILNGFHSVAQADPPSILPATGSALRLAVVAFVLVLLGAISMRIAGKRRPT